MKLFKFQNSNRLFLETFDCSNVNGKKRIRHFLPILINDSSHAIVEKAYTHSLFGYSTYIKKNFLNYYDNTPCRVPDCFSCKKSNIVQLGHD